MRTRSVSCRFTRPLPRPGRPSLLRPRIPGQSYSSSRDFSGDAVGKGDEDGQKTEHARIQQYHMLPTRPAAEKVCPVVDALSRAGAYRYNELGSSRADPLETQEKMSSRGGRAPWVKPVGARDFSRHVPATMMATVLFTAVADRMPIQGRDSDLGGLVALHDAAQFFNDPVDAAALCDHRGHATRSVRKNLVHAASRRKWPGQSPRCPWIRSECR